MHPEFVFLKHFLNALIDNEIQVIKSLSNLYDPSFYEPLNKALPQPIDPEYFITRTSHIIETTTHIFNLINNLLPSLITYLQPYDFTHIANEFNTLISPTSTPQEKKTILYNLLRTTTIGFEQLR